VKWAYKILFRFVQIWHFYCTMSRGLLLLETVYIAQWTRVSYHRLNGSSSPVLTATSLSYGKAKNSTPHRIKTPNPIDIKFGTVDYVSEGIRHAKFYANPSKGGFPANGWNIRKNFYSCTYIFFSETHLQVRPFSGFLRAMAQMTRSRARMCLLGVKKFKINI